MKAVAALRVRKHLVDPGSWHSGNVAKAAFPLAHVSKLKLGSNWQWCVQIASDGFHMYRVLVAFEPAKNQYWAWLGAAFGDDQAVIARVELHASHDGWHCHWKTGPLNEVGRGAVKASGRREKRRDCISPPVTFSKNNALGIANRLFNVVPPVGELGL